MVVVQNRNVILNLICVEVKQPGPSPPPPTVIPRSEPEQGQVYDGFFRYSKFQGVEVQHRTTDPSTICELWNVSKRLVDLRCVRRGSGGRDRERLRRDELGSGLSFGRGIASAAKKALTIRT